MSTYEKHGGGGRLRTLVLSTITYARSRLELRNKIVLDMTARKIIHIDMDAFYASVEQRDDPQLRGQPVVVAWRGNRSVVCAASYEARKFGVRSAMPAVRAERLCPNAIFLPPDFPRYRAVSSQVREIFKRHTDLIEPLSLDEAYLDVSENKTGLPTATQVARTIREQIHSELSLTASRGAEQIPREDCFGLEETGWALRHSTGRRRFLFDAAASRSHTRSRKGHRGKAEGLRRTNDRRSAENGFADTPTPLRPLWRAPLRVGPGNRQQRGSP